jgi:uncharacterized membrane protein YdjX (TVP38/TMEM64 family)
MYAEERLSDNKFTTSIVYFSIVTITTVFAPFAGLPLSPVVSVIIGPFLTSVFSIFGWTIGAMIAFFISRHLARPILYKFVDINKIEKYESYIPENHLFLWLIFLRIIIPVDILSYAIGLTKRINFSMYAITTFIGVIPFSFIWAYGGHSLIEGDYVAFYIFSGLGAILFFLSLAYYYTQKRNKQIIK